MGRPHVFQTDTTLYHAVEGSRVFPAGETDPGGAWSERIGGEAVGAATTTSALKDLIAAQDQIEALESRLANNAHDLAAGAKALEDARALFSGLEQRAISAEKALAESQAQAAKYMAERDQARAETEGHKTRAKKPKPETDA
jgi:uncharacterized phage infection (PIP) family protein YhgE